MRALAANRQVAAMTESAIRADFDQPLDVHRDVLAEIALDAAFALDDLADAVDLVFVEVLHLFFAVDIGSGDDPGRARMPDAVDVGQRDPGVLVARKIHACNTCHKPSLSLTLLVLGILADHPHHALAANDLALVANLFDRCPYFHFLSSRRGNRGSRASYL